MEPFCCRLIRPMKRTRQSLLTDLEEESTTQVVSSNVEALVSCYIEAHGNGRCSPSSYLELAFHCPDLCCTQPVSTALYLSFQQNFHAHSTPKHTATQAFWLFQAPAQAYPLPNQAGVYQIHARAQNQGQEEDGDGLREKPSNLMETLPS